MCHEIIDTFYPQRRDIRGKLWQKADTPQKHEIWFCDRCLCRKHGEDDFSEADYEEFFYDYNRDIYSLMSDFDGLHTNVLVLSSINNRYCQLANEIFNKLEEDEGVILFFEQNGGCEMYFVQRKKIYDIFNGRLLADYDLVLPVKGIVTNPQVTKVEVEVFYTIEKPLPILLSELNNNN